MIYITTPISHLFKEKEMADEILANSDNLECRDHSVPFRPDRQMVFHCELQPAHHMSIEDFNYLKGLAAERPNLELVSFHVASCYDKPLLINHIFYEGGNLISREQMLANASANFKKIKNIFGPSVKIAIENNNYYPTSAYQNVADPDFIHKLITDNDLCFLYDIAHAKVSAHNKNMSYEEYKSGLPLEKAIQLHICRYGINTTNNLAYDAHFLPAEEEYLEVENLLSSYPVKYLTVEYYSDFKGLISVLKKLKNLYGNQ